MKNLILPFFLFPLFLFGQYGLRNCHTDLVVGYDYGEVPFNFRYLVKSFGRDSRLFMEGGIQFNFYVFSLFTDKKYDVDGHILEEKMLERNGRFNDFNMGSQLSVGWEYDISEKLKYFVQPIGRFQLLPARRDFDFLEYQVGLETGVRF